MTFLKWAGGKGGLLSDISELFPDINNISGYVEPFIGGGSIFFYVKERLENKSALISDINPDLINTYRIVRDNVEELIISLKEHEKDHNETYYYNIRNKYPWVNIDNIERASRFIYLNKTCFNGLWRVNKDGKNNVPIGHKEKIEIFNRNELQRCSKLLKEVKINVMSFEDVLKIKNIDGFFVFLDPPYFDLPNNSNFTGYTKDDFHLSKKSLLLPVFRELDKRGCKLMLTNADSPIMYKLFKDYNISLIKAKRMINSDGKNRGHINEVVVTNYKPTIKQKNIMETWV